VSEAAKILYVDDEPGNLTIFEAAFEDDYDVILAESGAKALEILAQAPVDILITDMRMPKMTGAELLEKVIPLYPDTIRMVLTGYTDIESVVQAANQGRVYQFITKPWEDDQVRMLLRTAVEHAELLRQGRELRQQLLEQQHKEETIRSIFQRFAPSAVVDKVLRQDEGMERLAPELVDATLLFCDIRGFTGLCAQHEPRVVLELINAYFDTMTQVVDARGGTVNQFLGDAFLAIFGAPVRCAEHELSAVQAGLDMIAALRRFNEQTARRIIGMDLTVGIGIQRGPVAVGHVGATDKIVYTVIGDAVSQVAEVQARSKGYPNAVIATAEVMSRCGDRFVTLPHEAASLRTEGEPAQVFRVLGAVS
jgi:class 3 adenylate cyclase